jgi:uncharacterized membrane protein YeiH
MLISNYITPVMLTDSTGYWAGIDDLIAFGTGFVVGAGGQLVSDLITSGMTGEWSFSSLEVYAGAALGGAFGAMVLLYTGNPIVAGATTGFFTTFFGMGLESITGKNEATIWKILGHSAVDAGIGAVFVYRE